MRVVLDTNVVVSGLLWGGNPGRMLRAGRRENLKLFTSLPLLEELTNIMSRPKFKKRIAASQLSIDQLIDSYAELTSLVRPLDVPRLAPDVDDDVVIGTALAAKADLLVTGDQAFLAMMVHEHVRLVSVSDALDALSSLQR
jgi:hypothetical protein